MWIQVSRSNNNLVPMLKRHARAKYRKQMLQMEYCPFCVTDSLMCSVTCSEFFLRAEVLLFHCLPMVMQFSTWKKWPCPVVCAAVV